MLSNNVGGFLELGLLFHHELLLAYLEREQEKEEQATIVRGVSWLRDPLSEPKSDADEAPPASCEWTCPRCRSHRCILTNPGNLGDPVYCCCVCGYTFHKGSATRLPDSAD